MKYDALLDKAIRKVPNFPHEGILFYDITGILGDPQAFRHVSECMVNRYRDKGLAGIAVVESRGFVFGAPLALSLGIPLILVRKKGKLPGKTLQKAYALEYGEAVIEVQPYDVPPGGHLLVVDDLLATGGTLRAAAELLESAGGVVTDLFCVVGLPFLHPERLLAGRVVETLIDYAGELV
jgi:adenine phosphoribosyltransferase